MYTEEDYQETLDYLYSFVDYSLQKSFRYSPEKFDLSRMRAFVESLGNPERAYPIIHIAGTKGKGSVAALCASALEASGYRVGLYTSPHLEDYTERIQVNGQPMLHDALIALVRELKPKIEAIPELTTFEITTGLAFLYFQLQKANAAVIEVGLGGRLDATNVCLPAVAVITSLSYDHTYLLGDTLAAIAAEKAGIIKPGIPVVISPQKEEALEVLRRIADERKAPLTEVGRNYHFAPVAHTFDGQRLVVWPASGQFGGADDPPPGDPVEPSQVPLEIPLLGQHQVENAATAYAALRVAHENGLPTSESAIRRGFSRVSWPGRFEILRLDPPVIIDCAHNRDSARKLRLALDEYFPTHPVVLIFGASEDKDIQGMFAELLPRVRQVVATRSSHPRAIDPQALVEMANQLGSQAKTAPTIEEALEAAELLAGDNAAVLVTGSIFVAAAARSAWQERQGVRLMEAVEKKS
jgi:dihydrofolate synthase/folylpolyglutamate synthase